MAVGLESPGPIKAISGVRIGAVDAGLRKSSGEDLVVFEISESSSIAGVFTSNRARAAPVEVAMEHLQSAGARHLGGRRALVVNSGNANAGLGEAGLEDCLTVCRTVAAALDIPTAAVLPFSTGVIGERLALSKFTTHIGDCINALDEDNWLAAARAIMTTDTIPKAVSRTLRLDGDRQVCITGIAKGSGMIEPNMATMLAFVATDAALKPDELQALLSTAVDDSFNAITVDGDTSTNDSCILVATGESGIEIDALDSARVREEFARMLGEVTQELAQAIVRDGEGATKFVSIHVTGGASQADCARVAKTVANSPLVKTAMHASDPNWGRIYAAVGRAEVDGLELGRLRICINDVEVMTGGARNPDYVEADAVAAMRSEEFSISIDLGMQTDCSATVWTTDLSYEYVRINAEYRS